MVFTKPVRAALIVSLSLFMAACNNQEVQQGDYYNAHVEVTGEEGNPRAVVLVHLNKEGEAGQVVDSTAWLVRLDKQPVALLGAPNGELLFESQQEAESFAGAHQLEIAGPNKTSLKSELSFQPLVLQQEVPEQVPASGFDILLEPGSDSLGLRLMLTDTAFSTNDFHKSVEAENGVIHVSAEMLKNLASGPLNLELYRLHRRRLESVGRVNGMLEERYSLRRNTTLVK